MDASFFIIRACPSSDGGFTSVATSASLSRRQPCKVRLRGTPPHSPCILPPMDLQPKSHAGRVLGFPILVAVSFGIPPIGLQYIVVFPPCINVSADGNVPGCSPRRLSQSGLGEELPTSCLSL